VRLAGYGNAGIGTFTASRTRLTGFRQYDTAEVRQAIATWDRSAGARRTAEFRASYADTPVSRNPGALTAAEYAKNRDSASAFNIARGSNKWVSQVQVSARLRGEQDAGEWAVTTYVQRRFVDNSLATPPPGTTGPAVGTYSTLNRWVTGARADASWWSRTGAQRWRINAGADLQRSFDIRRNWRATGGRLSAPTDTLFLDQGESVIALGPFASAQVSPVVPLTISAGIRQDWVTFAVTDNFLRDGTDNSGRRTMAATSEHIGASWVFGSVVTAYANVAHAFETPTTTELLTRPGGIGGFNPDLGPQRIATVEAGLRGDLGGRLRYTATAFRASYSSAIVQYLETDGRAFFRNAGASRNEGVELGFAASLASWLDASLAWTDSRFRFTRYLAPRTATVTDTLDGKRVAGVPDRFYRVGLRSRQRGFTLDLDHTWSGDLYGDDRNTVRVADWGAGVLNARLAWQGMVGGTRIAPFAAVNNARNVAYVGAVTVNGANGRVLEPAPLRHFHFGIETGWRVVR
jgi:iron complex outermembrane receptor protein